MKDIKEMTAAELLAEWKHQDQASNPFSSWAWNPEYQREVADRLDKMCEDAGIAIYENQFVYNTTEVWKTTTRSMENDFMALAANGNLSASEQQDLQEWLLIKPS